MKATNTVICLLLVVILGMAICWIVRRSEINDLKSVQTELTEKNKDLLKQVLVQDSLLNMSKFEMVLLTDSILKQKQVTASLKNQYEALKKEHKKVLNDLVNIPVDSSYKFLTETAYPFEGEKKYPFNEPQVKEIHATYIDRIHLHFLNASLISQVWSQDLEISMQEARYGQARQSIDIMVASRKYLDTVIENQDKIIELQIRETKREKTKKILWQVGTGVAFLVGIII